MKYFPNLVPEHSKVLPEYFVSSPEAEIKPQLIKEIPLFTFAIIFIIIAIVFIKHPAVCLIYGGAGLLLLPFVKNSLERILQFKLTKTIHWTTVLIIALSGMPLANHYNNLDIQNARRIQLAKEQEEKVQLADEKKEHQRKDSIDRYIQYATQLNTQKRDNKVLEMLRKANLFSPNSDERATIAGLNEEVGIREVSNLIKKKDYKNALPRLNLYISSNPNNEELLYNRALCYRSSGNIEGAVTDLRSAMAKGHQSSEKLYNIINPIRRRIIGYETLC